MKKKYFLNFTSTVFIIIGLVIGVFLVQRVVRFFSGAANVPANLVINMATTQEQQADAWRNLAQGGEERGRMLEPVIPQVKLLKPEYIRIDHVFDFYDQKMLDNVIEDITSSGAKPFIALSYMPPELSKNGDVTDLPRNWIDWEDRIQNLVEHVSGKNGLNISDVYYEVWNEPDLFGNFKLRGDKSYLELYLHSAKGALRAKNTLPYKFGGPAVTAFYPNWMTGLLDYVADNNLPLDFLSWHKYSKDVSVFETDAKNAKEILAKYGRTKTELIITEMGPNSANDTVYDTTFAAIHQIAVSSVLQGLVSKAFAFEIKDGLGDKQYWGRWGLYTHEKFGKPVAKPRADAFTFLNTMIGGTKIDVTGQGSWVKSFAKKTSPTTTKVLVVNYDPAGIHNELVPITLTNLYFPNFTLKRTDFMGTTTSQEVATVSATWSTTAYFKPNSASIIEIIKK